MKDNIKRCIFECKANLIIQLFFVGILTLIFTFILSMIYPFWIVLPLSFIVSSGCDVMLNIPSVLFSFQNTSTTVDLYEQTSSKVKLSFISLKVIGDSDKKGDVVCKVQYIDGKYVEGMNIILPKSEIFKKNQFFWKQSFKPIG